MLRYTESGSGAKCTKTGVGTESGLCAPNQVYLHRIRFRCTGSRTRYISYDVTLPKWVSMTSVLYVYGARCAQVGLGFGHSKCLRKSFYKNTYISDMLI